MINATFYGKGYTISGSNKPSYSGGGLQPNPPRHDIGGALKKQIHKKRSSIPLKNYMQQRLDNLAKALGYGSYFDYELKKIMKK